MRPLAGLLAGLLGCTQARPPDCHTPCGAAVHGPCEGIDEAESAGVEALSVALGNVCQAVGGMAIYVWHTADGSWTDAYGRRVAGLTWCDLGAVEVGSTDYWSGAYHHELAHVAQCPEQDAEHRTWEGLGVWQALAGLRAKGLEQGSPDNIRGGDTP